MLVVGMVGSFVDQFSDSGDGVRFYDVLGKWIWVGVWVVVTMRRRMSEISAAVLRRMLWIIWSCERVVGRFLFRTVRVVG